MGRKTKGGAGAGAGDLGARLKGLIEAIAERVLARVKRELPDRQQIQSLERQVRALSRRIGSRKTRAGVRRVGRPRLNRRCRVAGCSKPHVAQGYCSRHYQAWRRKKMRGETAAKRSAGK